MISEDKSELPPIDQEPRAGSEPSQMGVMPTSRHRQIIEDALQIEKEDARRAGALGYMTRVLVQATLPHSDPKLPDGTLYSRDTGCFTLTIAPTSKRHGIPYGTVPRIIMAWICSESVRTRERVLSLGGSQSDFLEKVKLYNNGRDITRLRDQALRLFKSVISVEYTDNTSGDVSSRLMISDSSNVFWHSNNQGQHSCWDSSLELSEPFFREVINSSVPIDLRVFHSLSRSPLAMDVYAWLTYRMFLLRKSGRSSVFIPWVGLMAQFGVGYPDTQSGIRHFRAKFRARLKEVLLYYPEARGHIKDGTDRIILTPCRLHIGVAWENGEYPTLSSFCDQDALSSDI